MSVTAASWSVVPVAAVRLLDVRRVSPAVATARARSVRRVTSAGDAPSARAESAASWAASFGIGLTATRGEHREGAQRECMVQMTTQHFCLLVRE